MNRFNGFRPLRTSETVKTVSSTYGTTNTGLKPGENETERE